MKVLAKMLLFVLLVTAESVDAELFSQRQIEDEHRFLSASDSSMYRWLRVKASSTYWAMLEDSVISDSLHAVLVVDMQKQGMHNMRMTMLLPNHLVGNVRQRDPRSFGDSSMDRHGIFSESVAVPCYIDVWDVGFINPYNSLTANLPTVALQFLADLDTISQQSTFLCPLTNWNTIVVRVYYIGTRQSKKFHVASSSPFGGIKASVEMCSFVEQLTDRIAVGPLAMVMNKMLTDTIEIRVMKRPPRPKFNRPIVIPPKK